MHKVGRLKVYSVLALALLLSVTVLGRFRIFGAKPDLMIICVTFFGLFLGRAAGLEAGLVAGALTDLFSLDYFGINTFVYALTGFLAGGMKSGFVKESRRTQALAVFLSAAFSMCLHFWIAAALSRSTGVGAKEYIMACVLPSGAYTAAVSVPVFMKFLEMYRLGEEDDLL